MTSRVSHYDRFRIPAPPAPPAPPIEVRPAHYRVWTGGGTARLAERTGTYTAEELLGHRSPILDSKCLSGSEHARNRYSLECAIERGEGAGSAGYFERGSAAGLPVLVWRIANVSDAVRITYEYSSSRGGSYYTARALDSSYRLICSARGDDASLALSALRALMSERGIRDCSDGNYYSHMTRDEWLAR